MFKKLFAFPAARIGAAIILVLALLMAFPYTRALAGELLNLFRVQQVTVLPVDLTALESLTGNDALVSRLSELISDSTVITDEPSEPVAAADAEEASALAGFNVRLPADRTPSNIYVTDSASFTFTVDRGKAQSLVDEAGRSDLVLPQEIDGAEIAVSAPAAVNAAFGTCPEPRVENSQMSAPPESHPDCIIFTQMTSPMINAPESVDMALLARIGLEFTGMSREDAEAFTASIDWMTTLVVPIPRGESTYEDVSVDDVTGKLIRRTSEYAPEYALLWVKDGIIYFISGQGIDPARAFEIVDALP